MSKRITLMIIPEGSEKVYSRTFASKFFKIILAVAGVWIILLLAATFYYSKLTIAAARSSSLAEENNNLRGYLAKVVEIEKNFKKNRELVARLAEMAGVDLESYEPPDAFVLDSTAAVTEPKANAGETIDTAAGAKIPISKDELARETIPQGRPLYGWISRAFSSQEESADRHLGLDFAVKNGTPVAATASGVVTFAGWDDTFGNLVIIDHGNGFETCYGHNGKLLVEEGQNVLKGDIIALSGNTGRSSAPHLHYEIRRNGEAVDPAPYLD